MDIDALVKEIYARVQEKLRPKLLLLTGQENCQPPLENLEMLNAYQVECIQPDGDCDLAQYEVIVAHQLSNEALGKIANGIFDDQYTRCFGKALLLGKRIIVLAEAVELYDYEKLNTPYYHRLLDNLKLLEQCGVKIISAKELSVALGATGETVIEEQADDQQQEIQILKRVITEKDVVAAHNQKARCIVIKEKAMFTELAKEYVRKQKMTVKRQENKMT